MIDLIIENYPIYMRLGCYESEQLAGQRILVSLKMSYFPPEDDALADTLNYEKVIECLDEFLKGASMQLLETVVGRLGDHLMIEFSQLKRAAITVQKTVLPSDINKGAAIKMHRTFIRS